jgi:hypothetical protein
MLTEKDRPSIERFFDLVDTQMAKRKHTIALTSTRGDIDGTYQKFLELVSE